MQSLIAFFVLAILLSWTIVLIGIVSVAGLDGLAVDRIGRGAVSTGDVFPYLIASSFGPTLAAVFVLVASPQRGSLFRAWAKSFIRVRAPVTIYLLLIFALPVGLSIAALLFGFRPVAGQPAALVYLTLFLTPLNGVFAAVGGAGPLGEEPGWRGYANARLTQMGRSDLGAALVIAPVWLVWHAPAVLLLSDFRPDDIALPVYFGLYGLSILLMAICLARIWWTTQSTLLCIWFHGMANVALPYLADRAWNAGSWDSTGRMIATLVGLSFATLAFGLCQPNRSQSVIGAP